MSIVSGFLAPYVREADFAVRQPWVIGPRRILDYLLIYVQDGTFVATVEGREYRIEPGGVCLIQPDMRHVIEGRTATITPYAHFDLFYDPDNVLTFPTANREVLGEARGMKAQPSLQEMLGVQVPVDVQPQDPVRFRELLRRMVGTWQHDDMQSRLEANHLAMELILSIVRQYREPSAATMVHQPDSFSWITSYLSFHLSDPVAVSDMAERAGLSMSRFSVLFRQYFGCPPYQYLRRLRVSHAQDLLIENDLTLDVIAARCGFANAQHFAKVFRQEVGETPGAFRRRNRFVAEPGA